MSYFQVATDALTSAGTMVGASVADLTSGSSAVSGTGGACAGTPAGGEYNALVSALSNVTESAREAVSGLQGSLNVAAMSYAAADSSAAGALSVKGGMR